MSGLSFIHAGFLAAGLAAALPILIHLLFRQRTRQVLIGSVRFLHQVVREHRRKRRVRQWILLALRMLACLMLAMLFARPYWDRAGQLGLEQEVVFLIDRSASMQAKTHGETSLERALTKTRARIAELDDNVIVHLALSDATGTVEISIEELSAVTASEAATDFGLSLTWAREILAASGRSQRRIELISDLQRTGLSRSRIEHLPDGVELLIHDVGENLPRNVSIDSAEVIQKEIRPDQPVTVKIAIRNHGPLPVRQLQVHCELADQGGQKFSNSQEVTLNGRATSFVEIPMPIKVDGLYQGRSWIEHNDALVIDNQRWLAFEARHPDRVLLVDGQEGRSSFDSETYFLETALRLQTAESNGLWRSFEVERMVWETGNGFPNLDGFRTIVLANVRRLSPGDGERLQTYLKSGGSVLIFAGDQVTPDSVAPLQELGMLPGRLALTPESGRFRINDWQTSHPALTCFTDPQQGDLRRIEFRKFLPLEATRPETQVLLQVGGKILAAESQVGQGRIVYFGSTADRDWTDLPRTPMYVPLMRQLLAYLTDQLTERSAVTIGTISKPGDRTGIAPIAEAPGHWRVTNLDSRESALDRVTPESLLQMAGNSDDSNLLASNSTTELKLPPDAMRPDEIWTWLTWGLLLVLVSEMLLAGRVHA